MYINGIILKKPDLYGTQYGASAISLWHTGNSSMNICLFKNCHKVAMYNNSNIALT